jgi:anti-anti-sigma regulatory factor
VTTALEPDNQEEVAPFLEVELDGSAPICRLILRGALCHTSIAALEALVDQLGCLPCNRVVLELRHLTALDTVGANVILGLYYYVVGRGGELRVSGATGPIAATLRLAAGSVMPSEAGSLWGTGSA